MDKYLLEFIDLAKTCSYQDSAENLFISQSALSKHISALEEELDILLFARSTRSVTLTEAGTIFYTYAQKMVALQAECMAALSNTRQIQDNCLEIGLHRFLNYYNYYEIAEQFQELYPDIAIHSQEGYDDTLCEDMLCGKLNFCLTTQPKLYEDCRSQMLRSDYLVAVVSKKHPLAEFPEITVHQLKGEKFIIHSPKFGPDLLSTFWHTTGYKLNVSAEVSFNSTIMKLVAKNSGVSVMTSAQAQNVMLDSVVAIPITPHLPFSIYIVYKKGKELRPIEKKFLNYIMTCSQQKSRTIPKQDEAGEQ